VAKTVGTTPLKQGATTASTPDKPMAATDGTSSSLGKLSQQTGESAITADLQKAFEKIYFDFDSSTLSGNARKSLAMNFAVLMQNPLPRIRVEGNCDERGSDEYNLALGERRAQAAVRYLTTLGVPADRFSIISYGKEKPTVPGHDETALAKNRRDEFVISK
jgi:peptidoglycan-associated lipoprotein